MKSKKFGEKITKKIFPGIDCGVNIYLEIIEGLENREKKHELLSFLYLVDIIKRVEKAKDEKIKQNQICYDKNYKIIFS